MTALTPDQRREIAEEGIPEGSVRLLRAVMDDGLAEFTDTLDRAYTLSTLGLHDFIGYLAIAHGTTVTNLFLERHHV